MTEHSPQLLHGLPRIAAYLGISAREAGRRQERGELPTFRQGTGAALYARPSELDKHKRDRVPPKRGRPRCENPEERKVANDLKRKQAKQEARATVALEKARSITEWSEKSGLLYGIAAIAEYLGLPSSVASHLHGQGNIPTFKIGGKVCALRSTLTLYFAKLEEEAING